MPLYSINYFYRPNSKFRNCKIIKINFTIFLLSTTTATHDGGSEVMSIKIITNLVHPFEIDGIGKLSCDTQLNYSHI